MHEPINHRIRRIKNARNGIKPKYYSPRELEHKKELLAFVRKKLSEREARLEKLKREMKEKKKVKKKKQTVEEQNKALKENEKQIELEKRRHKLWIEKKKELEAHLEAHNRFVKLQNQFNKLANKLIKEATPKEYIPFFKQAQTMPLEKKVAFLEREINAVETAKKEELPKEKVIDETKKPKFAKIKRLYKTCFEIPRIEDDDIIPVGGVDLSDDLSIKVKCDFKHFEKFFQETHNLQNRFKLPLIKNWFASEGIEIDAKFFVKLLAFNENFKQIYAQILSNSSKYHTLRKKLYDEYMEKSKQIKLSDLFDVNAEECAEIAALAQGYLQRENVSSSYFSGSVLWKKETEISDPHSFIIIRQDKKTYIFDPANPTSTNFGLLPSLYTVDADFDKEMSKGQRRFVTARNVLSGKTVFYGINTPFTSFFAEDIV